MTSQMCCIGLRFIELVARTLTGIHPYASRTIPTQFEPYDIGRCPSGRSHFQLEDRRYVRVQLIRNYVQKVRILDGLFFHNYGSQSHPRERLSQA